MSFNTWRIMGSDVRSDRSGSMRIAGQITLGLLLLGISLGKTSQVTEIKCSRETQYQKFGKCCSRCAPGSYEGKVCTKDNDTVCEPCRAGTYSSSWTYSTKCNKCQPCIGDLVLKEECSLTKDYVCACHDGYNCTQYNAKGTRCQFCELVVLPTIPQLTEGQGYPAWIIATSVLSALLLAAFLGLLLFYFQKIVVKKCTYMMKKPQMESADHGAGSPAYEDSRAVMVSVPEEGCSLGYPTEETDASQSAVLLPNSFTPLTNETTQ